MASYPQYSVGKPNMGALTPQVAMAINMAASQLGISPGQLAAIIGSETAGSFKSDSTGHYKGRTFTGAIHYNSANLAAAAKKMGMTKDALTDSLVAEIMAIPDYAITNGFKPGEMDAEDLYATILGGTPELTRTGDIYGDIPGKQTVPGILATAMGGGRLGKFTDAVNFDQGEFIASIIGGGQSSDASYFGDLGGGGHQGLPFGLSPAAVANNQFTPATPNNTFAPSYAEQSPAAQQNTQFTQAQPNTQFAQAQPNNSFAQAQENTSFAPAQFLGDINAPPASIPTVAAPPSTIGAAPASYATTTGGKPASYGRFTTAQLDAASSALLAAKGITDVAAALSPLGSLSKADQAALGQYFQGLPPAQYSKAVQTMKGWIQGKDNGLQIVASNMLPMIQGLPNQPATAQTFNTNSADVAANTKGIYGGNVAPASMAAPAPSAPPSGQYGYAGAGQPTSAGPSGPPSGQYGYAGAGQPVSMPSAPGGLSPQAQVASLYGSSAGQNSIPTVSAKASPSVSATPSPYASAIASPYAPAIASPQAQAIAPTQAKAIASPTVASFAPPTVQANPAYAQAQSQLSAAQQTLANLAVPASMTPAQMAAALYGAPKTTTQTDTAAAEAAVAKAQAALANTAKTISVPGKKAQSTPTKSKTAPVTIGGIPIAAGIGGNGPGAYGFAKSTPSGKIGYTVNPNGTTTYSMNGMPGSAQTFSISGGIGGMPGSVGGAGVGYGAFGIGAPASAGWAYGGPTSNVGW